MICEYIEFRHVAHELDHPANFRISLLWDGLAKWVVKLPVTSRTFASADDARKRFDAIRCAYMASEAWAVAQVYVAPQNAPVAQEAYHSEALVADAIRTTRQLGMFGAQAGQEIGGLTGSQGAVVCRG